MFGNSTDRARKALRLAKEYAQNGGSPYIESEHILGAIWQVGTGVACNALRNLGVDDASLEEALRTLAAQQDPVPAESPTDRLPFSQSVKSILSLAVQEAQEMGHKVWGTEHLLLGLILEEDTVAHAVLVNHFNISADDVRKEIRALLGEQEASEEDFASFDDAPPPPPTGARKRTKKKIDTSHLDQFGIDLTELARKGKIDPIIGRHTERERLMQILGRKTKNNPVLIGEPGTGKTKIVEGIALDIVEGNVPEILKTKKLYALDLAAMVAGTKYRGQFEERIKKVMKEAEEHEDIILFIDEIHTMVGAGGAEGGMDASNILKPALSRGALQCIGATTFDEYRRYIEKDGALERRFQSIAVEPSTTEETLNILQGLRPIYQKYHDVEYTDEALQAAVDLSEKYITGRFLPDKAIDIVDEAGSRIKMSSTFKPKELRNKENLLRDLDVKQNKAVAAQEFEQAASLRDEKNSLRDEVEEMTKQWQQRSADASTIIDDKVIAGIVASMTDIPVAQISEEEGQRLLQIENALHESVISQDHAITAVAEAIRRTRSGLKKNKRPMGSFLFVGPTGVGKTLLCKALAKFLFGTEDALIHFDMSEYMEKHNASRLVGAPPGYVGYEEGGQLTERVRRKPYSVVLFDEIEKAHPDVFNMLLQIMEEGRLTDSFGRVTNFRNTIIIMTSNAGSDRLRSGGGLGFSSNSEEASYEATRKLTMEGVESTFKPEFLNRLDDIPVFIPLSKDDIKQIVHIELKELHENLADQGLILEIGQDSLDFLVDKGYNEAFGARPLRRAIEKYIENPLSKDILGAKFVGHTVVCAEVDKDEDCLVFTTKDETEAPNPPEEPEEHAS